MPGKRGSGKSGQSSRPKTSTARRLSKALKKHHAQVRQIAKKEHIPYAEARRRTKEVFIETIRRGQRKAADTWFRIGERKDGSAIYRRIKPKDVPKAKTIEDAKRLTYGPRKRFADVQRSIGHFQYWALVDRVGRMFDLPASDARKLLKRMVEEMTRTARQHGVKRTYRSRDAAAVLEYSDRYQYVRDEFGI